MAAVFARIATGDIDVVPTEAEVDDLISESEALAAEEARLLSQAQADAAAEAAALAAENAQAVEDFEVLVPAGSEQQSEDGDAPSSVDSAPAPVEPEESEPVEGDVLVLVPDADEEGEP